MLLPEFMYEAFESRSDELGNFGHGFTYSGHPVCAAVALKNLEIMEETKLFEHAKSVGQLLQEGLRKFEDYPFIGEVRGRGLIGGIEIVKTKTPREPFKPSFGIGPYCSAACQEVGLIVRNVGDVIAFCPPLIITESQIDELLGKFEIGLNKTVEWAHKEMDRH